MKTFREYAKEREDRRIAKRISTLHNSELHNWADHALFGIGRSLSGYQRSRDVADLDEATQAVEALLAVVKELKARA